MARRKNEIFAHNNKYEGNIFKKFGRWFGKLEGWKKGIFIGLIVILVIAIAAGSYILAKLDLLDRVELDESELSCVNVDGYINILLLGVDSRNMDNIEGAGADAIMILSIKEETGEVKLMSVYRDTYMKMGDTENYDKITNANRIGGPKMMIQSLNQAMDLNIKNFVVVNFAVVTDLVDAVGGIEVDVQDYEIEQLNKYTIQTAENVGKTQYNLVQGPGKQTLEGVQAVSYGRIRKGVGDDYKRTERMRVVLTKVFEKLKTMSIGELNDLLNTMLPNVQTNLSNSDMVGLASRLIDFNIKSGAGWPYEVTGGLLGGVSYVFPDDLVTNTIKLHQEMFGQQDYVPTAMVNTISNTIIANINASVSDPEPIDTTPEETETPEPSDEEQNLGPNGAGEEEESNGDEPGSSSGESGGSGTGGEDTENEGGNTGGEGSGDNGGSEGGNTGGGDSGGSEGGNTGGGDSSGSEGGNTGSSSGGSNNQTTPKKQ